MSLSIPHIYRITIVQLRSNIEINVNIYIIQKYNKIKLSLLFLDLLVEVIST